LTRIDDGEDHEIPSFDEELERRLDAESQRRRDEGKL
jgi:hypothetical protein